MQQNIQGNQQANDQGAASSLQQDARIIGVVGLAHGISHFFQLILAPLFPWLKQAFQLSYAELGLLMSMFFAVSGIGQAMAGFVVDRFGAGRVLLFGVSCLGLAAVILGFSQGYTGLALGAVLAGLGNSVFHPADYTLLNHQISKQRLGHAFSVHGLTGNLGWALAPLFLVPLAEFFGWRTALLAAAGLPVIVLVLLLSQRKWLLAAAEHHAPVEGAAAKSPAVGRDGALSFMKLPAVWMCFLFFLVTAMALGGIQNFSATSLRSVYGMSLGMATSAFSGYMLASALGMVVGGFLAARTSDHDKTIALAFSMAGVFSFMLAAGFANSQVALLLMACVGFGAGIAGPSRDLMIRAAAPKNATGRVYGMVYSGLDTGSALAPLLFGWMLDAQHPAWLFAGVGCFQMLAIVTAIRVGGRNRAQLQAA